MTYQLQSRKNCWGHHYNLPLICHRGEDFSNLCVLMRRAITQIEGYGYQQVIKTRATNHDEIKTVISNRLKSRTSCYHSNYANILQHHGMLHPGCEGGLGLGINHVWWLVVRITRYL